MFTLNCSICKTLGKYNNRDRAEESATAHAFPRSSIERARRSFKNDEQHVVTCTDEGGDVVFTTHAGEAHG